ncbi:MAG: NCS2 family permease [Elusimicrobia bacterium]|nr:NCS2 family permease [Candidatus Obscuribacterium magneticum]
MKDFMNKIKTARPPWLAHGDVDGFFGLFIDNLMQLMLITVLCRYACGFPAAFITRRILPGAAFSILAGNLFYSWQARRLAQRTSRSDVTALPFGINTVSLLAFIYLVMGPVYYETGDSSLAWKAGLSACFVSGLIETLGAFVGPWLKKHTPRAALLSALAGVALAFMVLGFSFRIFASPAVAFIPMMLVLTVYGARLKLPHGIPVGLAALLIGVLAAWGLKWAGLTSINVSGDPVILSWNWPVPAMKDLFSILFLPHGWAYVAVVIPIGLFNVIGSIQNLESAEAAGDSFETKPSLLANGVTSLLAACLGSPFPTSIYIGHPGWKAMGARTGYSALNGVVIMILCFLGGITFVLKYIPLEVTLGLLIWIGLVIVGQAFRETERRYSIAVAIGLIPALAAWALHIIETVLRSVGSNLYEAYAQFGGELYIHGIISLYQGFLLIGIILSAILAHVIDRKFLKAAWWSFVGALLSSIGLIHAYRLTPSGIQNFFGWHAASTYTVVYAVLGVILLCFHLTKMADRPVEPPY